MMDLFSAHQGQTPNDFNRPLAEALRPQQLSEMVGQATLLAEGSPLQQLLQQKRLPSLLLWGPPGVGKTTLARLLGQQLDAVFSPLNATQAGVKELRQLAEEAKQRRAYYQQTTIVFIDELHRFSKAQQDVLLPFVETGDLVLIGATTENPSFYMNAALLSRCQLVTLQPLEPEALLKLVKRALVYLQERDPAVRFRIHKEAMSTLLRHAQGDARKLLTLLEAAYWTVPRQTIDTMAESPINSHTQQATLTPQHLASILQQTTIHYDANGDQHYDHASALQKSIRGSDVDASLYWLAKMLVAGEDLRFISRRLMICAAEDIGLADPQAFILAQATSVSVEKLGMPEARIPLATLVVYLAKSPKSNAAYRALDAAMACVQEGHSYPVPLHLRDSHYSGASRLGHGQGYIYTHTAPEQAQQFLPDALVGKRFF